MLVAAVLQAQVVVLVLAAMAMVLMELITQAVAVVVLAHLAVHLIQAAQVVQVLLSLDMQWHKEKINGTRGSNR